MNTETTNALTNPLADEKDFLNALDSATGYKQSTENLPLIKFNATNGVWVFNSGEKTEDGKYIFNDIGPELSIHILNTAYNLANSGEKSAVKCYSKEYVGQHVVLYNQETREVVEEGNYKDLKVKYDLNYTKVLYAVYQDELVRVKVSGFSLSNFFKFLQANGNPSKFITKFSLGKRYTFSNGVVKEATKKEIDAYTKELSEGKIPANKLFYEFEANIEKELFHTFEDRQLIVKRVNDVNLYLRAKEAGSLTILPREAETELISLDEINVEQITEPMPFN
jgi:hypothetical protein